MPWVGRNESHILSIQGKAQPQAVWVVAALKTTLGQHFIPGERRQFWSLCLHMGRQFLLNEFCFYSKRQIFTLYFWWMPFVRFRVVSVHEEYLIKCLPPMITNSLHLSQPRLRWYLQVRRSWPHLSYFPKAFLPLTWCTRLIFCSQSPSEFMTSLNIQTLDSLGGTKLIPKFLFICTAFCQRAVGKMQGCR